MDAELPFAELIQRLRNGDADAARMIVTRYEHEVRRAIRVRLTDPRIRRVLDSMDIAQSVLANFFLRVGKGQFDLNSPQELIALLVKMVHHKFIDHTRKADARGRKQQLHGTAAEDALATTDATPSPSEVVADRELLEAAHRLMSPEERHVAEQRGLGREWADIAKDLDCSPEALRKRHERTLDRIATALGLETPSG